MQDKAEFSRTRLLRVLAITWLGYAAYSMGRRPFSVARAIIVKDAGLSLSESGWIDTAFLIMYTVAQLFYSQIQSTARLSARCLLVWGLIGSAATQFLMASALDFSTFIIAAALNGTLQAVGWSSCMVVVAPWIGPAERGSVMGLWGTTIAFGGVFGNTLTPTAISMTHSWRGGLNVVGIVMAAVGVALYFVLGQHPNAHGFLSPTQEAKGYKSFEALLAKSSGRTLEGEIIDESHEDAPKNPNAASTANGPRQLLAIPGVMGICSCYFFAKLVRYVLMFWLPFLFTEALQYSPSEAGIVASALDIGGVVGTIGSGIFCDRFGGGKRRTAATMIISFAMVVLLSGFSLGLRFATSSWYASVICFGCGFCAYGLDMIITGALLQDVTDRQSMSHVLGGISGLVGGIGTLGSVVQGPFTVAMSALSWNGVFGVLQLLSAVSMVCLYPTLKLEMKSQPVTPKLLLKLHSEPPSPHINIINNTSSTPISPV